MQTLDLDPPPGMSKVVESRLDECYDRARAMLRVHDHNIAMVEGFKCVVIVAHGEGVTKDVMDKISLLMDHYDDVDKLLKQK